MPDAPHPAVVRHLDAASELILDDTHLPILVATFFGEVTPNLVDAFNAWMELQINTALVRGDYLALVTDGGECEGPGPEARRKLTDHTRDRTVVLASPCVITSSVVGAAVTAIGWVMGKRAGNISSWPTVEGAIGEAVRVLTDNGVQVDHARVAQYQRPARTAHASLPGK